MFATGIKSIPMEYVSHNYQYCISIMNADWSKFTITMYSWAGHNAMARRILFVFWVWLKVQHIFI